EVAGDLRSVIEARVARRHKPGDPQHDEGYSTEPGDVIEARLSHFHSSSVNDGRWRPNAVGKLPKEHKGTYKNARRSRPSSIAPSTASAFVRRKASAGGK